MVETFINNVSLLMALSLFYAIVKRYKPKNEIYFQIISGVWFGLVAIASMMMPYEYSPGIIYDGRSIILTLAGLWGGGYTVIVSVLISGVYRIFLGGAGIWGGLATVISCGSVGLLFRIKLKNRLREIRFPAFWIIGTVSHLFMLASQVLVPVRFSHIIREIWLPILVIFPLVFALIARFFQLIDTYISSNQKIWETKELYRTTLLSIGDAVICTEKNGHISHMNKVAENLTGWKYREAKGRKLDKIFNIINEESRQKVESPFDIVIRKGTIVGLANHTLLITKDGREIPIADSGAPIKNRNKEVIGVVLVFRDQTEEREQQKRLKESEAKYREREFWLRESQRVGKIGSYNLDIVNDHWSASEVMDDIFGITKDDPHNLESWLAVVHPEQNSEMLDYFMNSVIKEKNPFEKEYKIIRKSDGNECWVLGYGELVLNDAGEPVRMFGTIQDITKRKLFEQKLIQSEERFRNAILNSPIPIMVHDDEGNVIILSEGWNHFSGYHIEDIPTIKDWANKAYGDESEKMENSIQKFFEEKNTVLAGESEITTKQGKKRIWNFYRTPLGISGNNKLMLSMAPDVTQRIRMKKELEESESSYRQLFENHTAIKFLVDPDNGSIVKANQAAANFYGWSIDEIEKMNLGDINTLSREEIRKAMDHVRKDMKVRFEFKHRLSNGQIKDVEVLSSKTEYKGKELLHSIIHDVTEKKRLMNELIKAKERAEESDHLKSAFLANMSHEIRTPLNGIVGFTNLLTNENNLSKEEKQRFSQIINKSTEGLLKIINDILDISRLETGKTTFEKKVFDVGKTLSSLHLIFYEKLKETEKKSVKLIYKEFPQKVYLNTDENRLIQVFSNLLDNALRFTHQGSIEYGISEINDEYVEFYTSDTGIGIPKNKQQLVFESFTQAESGMTRSYGGTGLGLAIVKKLIELLDGEIMVESEQGKGSRFSFRLPGTSSHEEQNDNEKIEEITPIPAHNNIDTRTKILIVEDDESSRLYFRLILSKHYKNLYVAETGEQALNLYDAESPDIILMDIGLPDINGLELVKKIREKDQEVKIIAQTAYAMAGDKFKALQAGCNDFITKPLNTKSLLNKLISH